MIKEIRATMIRRINKNHLIRLVMVVMVGDVLCLLPERIGSESVVLEQQPSGQLQGNTNITVFSNPRALPYPTRPDNIADQWQVWIKSLSNPIADDEVSQQTAGILLQVGFVTSAADNRKMEIGFRYMTGTDYRHFYEVRSHVYEGTPGVFNYWRLAWLPLLLGENLSAEQWYRNTSEPTSLNTTPVTRFIGAIRGLTDESS